MSFLNSTGHTLVLNLFSILNAISYIFHEFELFTTERTIIKWKSRDQLGSVNQIVARLFTISIFLYIEYSLIVVLIQFNYFDRKFLTLYPSLEMHEYSNILWISMRNYPTFYGIIFAVERFFMRPLKDLKHGKFM